MTDFRPSIATGFAEAFASFDASRPVLVLTHNDADGLAAGALFVRALDRVGRSVRVRVLGRGENPWSDAMRAELAGENVGGVIVADLGVRDGAPLPGTPTIVVDHHVPAGNPDGAVVLSGYGFDPVPTSSLLAFVCASTLVDVGDLGWLAAVGLVGDLGDKAPFPELAASKAAHTATALKECVALVNAPRRAALGDAAPALALLLRADGPKDAISGRHGETALLQAARAEVKLALDVGKRVAPQVRGEVALVELDSPCQIHPLVAQAWRLRLRDRIVIAANRGYRPGWVHFATRSGLDRDLIAFLRDHRPAGADENYGNGHRQATGGALRPPDWEQFKRSLGFGAASGELAA